MEKWKKLEGGLSVVSTEEFEEETGVHFDIEHTYENATSYSVFVENTEQGTEADLDTNDFKQVLGLVNRFLETSRAKHIKLDMTEHQFWNEFK